MEDVGHRSIDARQAPLMISAAVDAAQQFWIRANLLRRMVRRAHRLWSPLGGRLFVGLVLPALRNGRRPPAFGFCGCRSHCKVTLDYQLKDQWRPKIGRCPLSERSVSRSIFSGLRQAFALWGLL